MDDDDDRDGVVYEEFRQRLYALDLTDRVTFVGSKRNDLREWLAGANLVLALANQPESIGINVLQAIHLGTPVVGWNKGAFGEILAPLYPQGLVKTGNAYALCKVVSSQLKNPMRPAMTDKFTMKQMIEQTLAVYDKLANIDSQNEFGELSMPDADKKASLHTSKFSA